MKMRMWKRGVCVMLLSLLMLCALLPAEVFAREAVDTKKTASFAIQYPCGGIRFRLYQVATVDVNGHYALTDAFKDYRVNLSQGNQEEWDALALTLDGYALRDQIVPDQQLETQQDGTFTVKDLPLGLYLVSWDRHVTQDYLYEPVPFLVALPNMDEQGTWEYDVRAEPKYELKENPQKPEEPEEPEDPGQEDPKDEDPTEEDKEENRSDAVVSCKVEKVWKDNDNALRPESVKVQLLRDGKEWRVVTLDASNNWSFEWKELDAGYRWLVVEEYVPENYFVSVWRQGDTFVVTNTSRGYTPVAADSTAAEITATDGTKLPQTGVLWWPVPVLMAGGILLFLFGWLRHRNGEKDA